MYYLYRYNKTTGGIISCMYPKVVADLPDNSGDIGYVITDVLYDDHYLTWTTVDQDGFPIDPVFTEKEELTFTLLDQVGTTRDLIIYTSRSSLPIAVGGTFQSYPSEDYGGQNAVVLQFSSTVPYIWSLKVIDPTIKRFSTRIEIT